MDNIDKIRENIKSLKDARGKTWEQFAFDLGFDNFSNLSNKIYRDKTIDTELLTNIANYFGMTLKELINEDFSQLEKNSLIDLTEIPLEDFEGVIGNYYYSFLPIVYSKKAAKNDNFKEAYDMHISFYQQLNEMDKDSPLPKMPFAETWNLYLAARKEDIIEASVNMLALLGYKWYCIIINSILYGHDENDSLIQSSDSINLIGTLSAMSKGMETPTIQKQRKLFLDKYNGTLTNLMNTVQNSKQYYQYAYYFLAFRYGFAMMDSEITGYSIDEERSIGQQLMLYLSYMGNKYAEDYLALFDED